MTVGGLLPGYRGETVARPVRPVMPLAPQQLLAASRSRVIQSLRSQHVADLFLMKLLLARSPLTSWHEPSVACQSRDFFYGHAVENWLLIYTDKKPTRIASDGHCVHFTLDSVLQDLDSV